MDIAENSTANCSGRSYIRLSYKPSYLVVTCISIVIATAVLLSTIIYCIKKYKRTKFGQNPSKKHLDMMILVVSFSVAVSAFINIGRFTSSACFYYTNYSSINLAEVPFITVGYTGVYAVIWYRVWLIINHPVMSHLRNKVYNACSIIVIILIVASGCANFSVYIYTNTPSYVRLQYQQNTTKTDQIRYLTFSISVGVYQTILLALFSYPILKQYFQSQTTISRRKSLVLLTRTVITTALCSVTDLLLFLIYFFVVKQRFSTQSSEFQVALFYDVNLIINLLFLLLSFSDWRQRFIPFLKVKSDKSQNNSMSMMRSPNSNRKNGNDKD